MNRLAFIVAISLLLAGCDSQPRPTAQSTSQRPAPSVQSDEVTLRQCFGAADEDTFDELLRYSTRGDERGVEMLVSSGKVIVIPADTNARIIDRGIASHTVRIEQGAYTDREVIVAVEFVSPR